MDQRRTSGDGQPTGVFSVLSRLGCQWCETTSSNNLLIDEENNRYVSGLLLATERFEVLLNEKGDSYEKKRKHSLIPFLKATIRLLLFFDGNAKSEIDAVLSGPEMQHLAQAAKVRDRLMHPHQHADVSVSGEEMKHLQVIFQWMTKFVGPSGSQVGAKSSDT
jgi:hypothetical protein